MIPDGPNGRGKIYLDSASLSDASRAADLRYVAGITTNPSLMASVGRPPLEQLSRLLDSFPGSIFYQINRLDAEQGRSEALQAVRLAPERVVLKIPARSDLYGLAATLVGEGVACAITAVYSPGQALLAAEVGAEWVIPYVDRASRLLDDGESLVTRLAAVLAHQTRTEILAASVKSPEQAVQAVVDGAGAITAALPVLEQLAEHPLTVTAVEDFSKASSVPR